MVIKFFELNGTTHSGSLSFSYSIGELNITCILWKIHIVKEQIYIYIFQFSIIVIMFYTIRNLYFY